MANVSREWAREFVILSSRIAEQIMASHELTMLVRSVETFPAKFTAEEIHAEVEKILDRSAARFADFLVSEELETGITDALSDFNERGEVGEYEEF